MSYLANPRDLPDNRPVRLSLEQLLTYYEDVLLAIVIAELDAKPAVNIPEKRKHRSVNPHTAYIHALRPRR